jgi:ATP-binding cassette subfamily A (ABC1) protein 3
MDYNHGIALYAQQFRAMFIKRVLHTWRNKMLSISQLAVPLVFTIIALTVVKTLPIDGDLPPLPLNLSKIGENVVSYSTAKYASTQTKNLAKLYKSQFIDDRTQTEWVNNISEYKADPDIEIYLIYQGKESVSRYNSRYIVAASFENKSSANVTSATAYFNNQAYHSPGMTLNVLNNAVLKYFTQKEAVITTINHPLPRGVKERVDDETETLAIGFSVSFCVLFGMAFLASSFVMFLIKERATKAKHCQFVSGVQSLTFWSSTFCWDFINFMVPVILLIVVFAAFGIEGYVEPDRLPLILLIFILYGWAMLPFMYLLSYIFTVPSTGLVWLSIFNIFSGEYS